MLFNRNDHQELIFLNENKNHDSESFSEMTKTPIRSHNIESSQKNY
jgi:hypothetical protein